MMLRKYHIGSFFCEKLVLKMKTHGFEH